jgi:hypothetical protein
MRVRQAGTRGVVATIASIALIAGGCTGIVRQSVSSAETQGNGASSAPAVDDDGHFIAFESSASNLVPDDTNGVSDVFVRDTLSGVTVRVSVATNGTQANGASTRPFISADGRFVAFTSMASNLTADDTNTVADVFVRDRHSRTTTLVSKNVALPAQANAISRDGRRVLFTVDVDPNGFSGEADIIELADVVAGAVVVSQQSDLSNCAGSTDQSGFRVGGAAMDGDGSIVAYWIQCGLGTPILRVIVHEVTGNDTIVVDTVPAALTAVDPNQVALSADGGTLVWAFATISGRAGTNQHAFLWHPGTPTPVAENLAIPEGGFAPLCLDEQCVTLSPNGRYLAFETSSGKDPTANYVCPCRVVLMGVAKGIIHDVSVSKGFQPRDGHEPFFEGDGNRIAFSSDAGDLVDNDTNGVRDAFTRSVQAVLARDSAGTTQVSG